MMRMRGENESTVKGQKTKVGRRKEMERRRG